MKKSLKNLQLKKQTISNLSLNQVRGGGVTSIRNCEPTAGPSCNNPGNSQIGGFCGNSVPVEQGGIGCHAF